MGFAPLLDYATIVGALVTIAVALNIARNKAVLENYRVTVESQNVRMDALEAENKDLRERVTKLEGIRDGYEIAAELWVKAVTNSGVCRRAWDCPDRVIPALNE